MVQDLTRQKEEFYGNSELDWVVLMTANGNESQGLEMQFNEPCDLYKYAENKYGTTGLLDPHHYETTEVKDAQGRLILPAGKVVDEDFQF